MYNETHYKGICMKFYRNVSRFEKKKMKEGKKERNKYSVMLKFSAIFDALYFFII